MVQQVGIEQLISIYHWMAMAAMRGRNDDGKVTKSHGVYETERDARLLGVEG
jgi:hypothetical protein